MLTDKILIDKVKSYNSNLDVELLQKACDFSKQAHGVQKRASGDAYFLHPLHVAYILAGMRLDTASIITALMHDTIEDTGVTFEELKEKFGLEVATLVDGVTKLAKIEYQTEHTRQAENFRKLLLAMSEDIRVLIVKLADRLHNMRTLHYIKSPEKRARIARETMDIFAPLAERIGMHQFKNELQDLAFAALQPETRNSIINRLDYLRKHDRNPVENIIDKLKELLIKNNIEDNIRIEGREKTPCSIWRKMEVKNVSFELLSDIMAFRIISKDMLDCYKILGIIHANYHSVPDSFKDFISNPKENGYQSLHTVVIGPFQRFIEVQIRTEQMHEVAENGVAAHWSYKSNDSQINTDGKQYKWLRELLYILENASHPEEFLENTKLEIYYNQVFCFTPKGKLIALPKGATALDFAYEVHSDIGNRCSKIKINGRAMPLRTQIHNGDQIEVTTSDNQRPAESWEKFVVTGKAKSEIRRYIRSEKRKEYVKLGRALIDKRLKKEGIKLTTRNIKQALKILSKKNIEDVYEACGEGIYSPEDILRSFFPEKKIKRKRPNPLAFIGFIKSGKKESSSLPIIGLQPGIAVYFAECCHPIPGDSIVGTLITGKGMVIHTADCETLSNFSNSPEKLVNLSWGKTGGDVGYNCRIKVILSNEAGSLATLCSVIAQNKSNITNLRIIDRSTEFFEVLVDVGVLGDSQLNDIIASLRAKKTIHAVKRVKR